MSFNYSVNINDTIGYPDDAQLISALNAALGDFSSHMSGKGTLVTQLNLGDAGASRADGSSTAYLTNGLTAGGQTLVQLGSIEAIKKLVAAGICCSAVPRLALEAETQDFVVVPLSPPLRRQLGVVLRPDKKLDRGLREVVRALGRPPREEGRPDGSDRPPS